MPRIPLIEDLTAESIPAGYALLVEYDPASVWYSTSLSMAAGWIKTGGEVSYSVHAQPPQNVRSYLKRFDLNVQELENNNRLRIHDWYTATLGHKSSEKLAQESMKVHDLSIYFAKTQIAGPAEPTKITVDDTLSPGTRFNDEKSWFEFVLTRIIPMATTRKITKLLGLTIGVHSEWAYKTLESVVDGIIDFKLDETTNPPRSALRIRRLREVSYDGRWHTVKIDENSEARLDK